MVFKFQLWFWLRLKDLNPQANLKKALFLGFLLSSSISLAQTSTEYLKDAETFFHAGHYFKAARYAFAAGDMDESLKPEAYSWVCVSLIRSGLYHSAAYFFIRTLQTANTTAKRRVLGYTQDLLVRVGADLLRKYLIRHSRYEDYDLPNRSAYLYALAKDTVLRGKEQLAIGYVGGMSTQSPLWPFGLLLRGTAHALLEKSEAALSDFEACIEKSHFYVEKMRESFEDHPSEYFRDRQRVLESQDLEARCLAGKARTLYQMNAFSQADQVYNLIPKSSFVWPDILFEQAWNSFGQEQYNVTLGKVASYKSPLLSFVYNSEADVLKAQAYLFLCLYDDANEAVNEFNGKYSALGEEVKRFVENNKSNISAFYTLGKAALQSSIYTKNSLYKLMNRFVRGPYFQNLVATQSQLRREANAISQFNQMQAGVLHDTGEGFPGFLELVLNWRAKSVALLGGVYVKNSLIDYHATLISDFEKMAFIKLEMLSRAKQKLVYKKPSFAERSRGNVKPSRHDDQYYWSFNGEFWLDELGDYVFGLESECGKS